MLNGFIASNSAQSVGPPASVPHLRHQCFIASNSAQSVGRCKYGYKMLKIEFHRL